MATPPASVTFSANGSNAARKTTAKFTAPGSYAVICTITDAANQSITSEVTVSVVPTLTSIALTPAFVRLNPGATKTFTATAKDQFAAALVPQPAIAWSASDGGAIDASGLFTAGSVPGGPVIITAAAGGKSRTASVTINAPPTVATAAAASSTLVTGKIVTLSALGADDLGESKLTYTWSTTGMPPAAVTFAPNKTNASKSSVATFRKAGAYTLLCTIKDQGGLTATTGIDVTVAQTPTTVVVAPSAVRLNPGAKRLFTASVKDQFVLALVPQPAVTWSTPPAAGSVAGDGTLTASATPGGPFPVTASTGSISGAGAVTINAPPTVATAVSASPAPVTGTTTTLNVLGADDLGEGGLKYTWATSGTVPAPVLFSANASNAAKSAVATFSKPGAYILKCTIADAGGLRVTSSVAVTVQATATTIAITPLSTTIPMGASEQFTATVLNQFTAALVPQPAITWAVSGGGSISGSGLFAAANQAGGPFTVQASGAGLTGTASVTVTAMPPTVVTVASATPNPVTGTTTAVSALGSDAGGESGLTYAWSSLSGGPAPVSFSPTGTNAAKASTATFSVAGAYTVRCTITNPSGYVATTDTAVTVAATATTIAVTPTSASVSLGGSQTFLASVINQFGGVMTAASAVTWGVTGGGTIDGAGQFSAGTTPGGPFAVTASLGSVQGTASVSVINAAPTIVTATSASGITATTATLSVLGADDGGESNLMYTWLPVGTPPGSVSFSANGTNAAKATTLTIDQPGTYQVLVIVTDALGLSTQSTPPLTLSFVAPLLTAVLPATARMNPAATRTFTAADKDGNPLVAAWSASAGGVITADGVLTTNPSASGTITVTATAGGITKSAVVTINAAPILTANIVLSSSSLNGGGSSTIASIAAATDDTGEAGLTYTWALSSSSPLGDIPIGTLAFSANGTNAAKTTTITASGIGHYEVTVTVTDSDGAQVTSFGSTFSVWTKITVDPVADQTALAGGTIGPINLQLSDSDFPPEQIQVSAWADDTSLVDTSSIIITGTGSSRILTARAVSGSSGTTQIWLWVSDPVAGDYVALFKVTISPFERIVFTPNSGSYFAIPPVTIATSPPGGEIWYTTSASGIPEDPVPGQGSAVQYTGPITLLSATAIKAKYTMGGTNNPTAVATYVLRDQSGYGISGGGSATSTTSPYCALGTGATDKVSITASVAVNGNITAVVPVTIIGSNSYYADIPLVADGMTEVRFSITDEGGTTITRTQQVSWGALTLAGSGAEIVARAGDAIRFSLPNQSGITAMTGVGASLVAVSQGSPLTVSYASPGIYQVKAFDADGAMLGWRNVRVIGVSFPTDLVACEVNHQRTLMVPVFPPGSANLVDFISGDSGYLTVGASGDYDNANLTLKPLKRGLCVALAQINGSNGPIVSALRVREFQFDLVKRGNAGLIIMRPFLPGIVPNNTFTKADHDEFAQEDINTWSAFDSTGQGMIPHPEIYQPPTGTNRVRITRNDALADRITTVDYTVDVPGLMPQWQHGGITTIELSVSWSDPDGDGAPNWDFPTISTHATVSPANRWVSKRFSVTRPVDVTDATSPDAREAILRDYAPAMSQRHSGNTNPISMPSRQVWPFPDGLNSDWWWTSHPYQNYTGYVPFDLSYLAQINIGVGLGAGGLAVPLFRPINNPQSQNSAHLVWTVSGPGGSATFDNQVYYGPGGSPIPSLSTTIGAGGMTQITTTMTTGQGFLEAPGYLSWQTDGSPSGWLNNYNASQGSSLSAAVRPGFYVVFNVEVKVNGLAAVFARDWALAQPPMTFTQTGGTWSNNPSYLYAGKAQGQQYPAHWTYRDIGSISPHYIPVFIYNYPVSTGGTISYALTRSNARVQFYRDSALTQAVFSGQALDATVTLPGSATSSGLYAKPSTQEDITLKISTGSCVGGELTIAFVGAGTGQPAPRDATSDFFDGRLLVNHGTGNSQMTFPVLSNRSGRLAPEVFLSYNSQDGTDCGYGPGWRTNYDMRILGAVYNDTAKGSAQGFVLVDELGGRRIISNTGVFREPLRPDTIFHARRADTPPPDAADWKTGEWTRIVRRGGERCYFDDQGWLKRIQQPDGQELTVQRDGTTHKITTVAVGATTLDFGTLSLTGSATAPMASLDKFESGKWDFTYKPVGPSQLPMLATAKINGTTREQTGSFRLISGQSDVTATMEYDANSLRLTSLSLGDVDGTEAKTTFDFVTNDSDFQGHDCVRETGNLSGLRKWFLRAANNTTIPLLIDQAGLKHFLTADDQRIIQRYHGTTGQKFGLVDFVYDGVGNLTRRTSTLDAAGNKLIEEFTWGSLTKAEGQLEITGTNVLKSSRVIGVSGIDGAGTRDLESVAEYSTDTPSLGYLKHAAGPLGMNRRFAYDKNLLTKVVQDTGEPNGRTWIMTPDAAGRPTRIQTPAQRFTRMEYPSASASAASWSQPPALEIPTVGFKTSVVRDQAQRVITTYPPGGGSGGVSIETDYDPLGRITRQRDEEGRETTYTFDVLGRLRIVHHTARAPDPLLPVFLGKVTYATIPDDTITYEKQGNTWLVTAKRGSTLVLSKQRFDLLGRLVEDIVAHSQVSGSTQEGTTVYHYDPLSGYLNHLVDARQMTTTQETDRVGRVLSVTPPAPAGKIHRTYNVLGWLLSQTDGNQLTTRFTYDQGGRVVRTINPAGGWIQQSYDASGQPSRSVTSQGMSRQVKNDTDGIPETSTDSFGNNITVGVSPKYDGGPTPLSELTITATRDGTSLKREQHLRADALPDKTTTTIDGQSFDTALVPQADGSITQVTPHGLGPQGTCRDGYGRPVLVWTTAHLDGQDKPVAMAIDYDATSGLVIAKHWLAPLGRTETYQRDPITGEIDVLRSNAHQPKTSGSASVARVWQVLNRDLAGNVLSQGRFDGTEGPSAGPRLVTTQTVDNPGRLKTVTPPGGPTTTRLYDAGGRVTDLDRAGTIVMHQAFDSLGNVIEHREGATVARTAAYDDLGRLVQQTNGTDIAIRVYDPVTGFLTHVFGPGNRSLERIPDSKGRLWQVKQDGVLVRTVTYDALDRVTGIVHADLRPESRRYEGDSLRVASATDRGGRTTVNQHDAGGALASSTITGAGVSTTVVVTHGQVTGADGSPAGVREQRQVDGGPILATETDRAGRSSAITQPGLPEVLTVYDVAGRTTNRGAVTYGYNQNGKLGTISHSSGTAILGYDQLGRLGTLSLPNGVTRGWTYDGITDRVTQMIQSINGLPEYWDVTRDVRGRVLTVTSSSDGTTRYIYSAERLVQESGTASSGRVVQYAYDARDNRTRTVTFTGIAVQAQDFSNEQFGALAPASGQWQVGAGVVTATGDGSAVLTPSQGTLPIGPEIQVSVRPAVPTAGAIRGGIALAAGAVTYEAVWETSLSTGFSPMPQARLLVRLRSGQQVAVLAAGALVADDGVTPETLLIRPLPQNLLQIDASGPGGTTRIELVAPGVDTTTGVGTVSLFSEGSGATASVAFDNLTWQQAALRTSKVADFTLFNQLATEDETTSDGGIAHTDYTYNDLGDMLGSQRTGQGAATTVYGYDAYSRLTSATVGGITTTATYDADRWFRRSLVSGATTTTFAHDGQGLFQQTVATTGFPAITTAMVNNGHTPLWESSSASSSVQTYAHDPLGNVIGLIGTLSNGTASQPGYRSRYDFDAYGRQMRERIGQLNQSGQPELVSLSSPTNSSGPRYKGMWFDGGSTNLYKTQTRSYAPELGRFTQVDPARAGQNWFAAFGSEPVNRIDPTGLDWEWQNGQWVEQGPDWDVPKPRDGVTPEHLGAHWVGWNNMGSIALHLEDTAGAEWGHAFDEQDVAAYHRWYNRERYVPVARGSVALFGDGGPSIINGQAYDPLHGESSAHELANLRRDIYAQINTARWERRMGYAAVGAPVLMAGAVFAPKVLVASTLIGGAFGGADAALGGEDILSGVGRGGATGAFLWPLAPLANANRAAALTLGGTGFVLGGMGAGESVADGHYAQGAFRASLGFFSGVYGAAQLGPQWNAGNLSLLLQSGRFSPRSGSIPGGWNLQPKGPGTTRLGVPRTNASDWRMYRDLWDTTGYSSVLSAANRARIAQGLTPVVDSAWVGYFPGDARLIGEYIQMHHIRGLPFVIPLPASRHLDAHMPGGFRYNAGGPGGNG